MSIVDTLLSLRRRWYIVLVGLIGATVLAFGVWTQIAPTYERSASQLLLPGETSVPEGGNPYLYIGGLSQAADVVVLALGAENVLDHVAKEYPGVEVQVTRETSTSSPVIVITVAAPTDDLAGAALDDLVSQTGVVLADLQDQEGIGADNRISVNTITVDDQSVAQQKNRITMTVAAGAGATVAVLVLAALVDGLVLSRKRRRAVTGGRKKAVKGSREIRRQAAEPDWPEEDEGRRGSSEADATVDDDELEQVHVRVAAESHSAMR